MCVRRPLTLYVHVSHATCLWLCTRVCMSSTPYILCRLKFQCRHNEEEVMRLCRERDELTVSLPVEIALVTEQVFFYIHTYVRTYMISFE